MGETTQAVLTIVPVPIGAHAPARRSVRGTCRSAACRSSARSGAVEASECGAACALIPTPGRPWRGQGEAMPGAYTAGAKLGTPGGLWHRARPDGRSLGTCRPANTGCCSQRGRALWSRIIFCAAALQQNPVSLGRVVRSARRHCVWVRAPAMVRDVGVCGRGSVVARRM